MAAIYPHIAVCVDRSEPAADALNQARQLFEQIDAERLSVVHVAPWPLMYAGEAAGWAPNQEELEASAGSWLDELIASVPGATGVLLEGYPPVAVCDWAADNDVSVLMAASHRGLVERVLLGSFAGYLVRHAPCAVLLTRPLAGGGKK